MTTPNTLTAPWSLVSLWTFACGVAGFIVGYLEGTAFQFLSTIVFTGIFLGTGQWLVLRRRRVASLWWVPVTAAGWLVGFMFPVPAGAMADSLFARVGMTEVFWVNLITEGVAVAVMAALQSLLVFRRPRLAMVWVLVGLLAGAASGAVGATTCQLACDALSGVARGVPAGVADGAGWAAYGLVSGLALVWMLTERAQAPTGSVSA